MEHKFRNYNDSDMNVKLNYKNAREKQTYDFVTNYMMPKYLNFKESPIKLTILEALDKLSNFVDLSDPDMELPNNIHLYQTAEAIRKQGYPDWFQLVGLIHDLGKIMYMKGNNEDGTSMESQFSIVGDTFIVGYPIPDSIVYPEFNQNNIDTNNLDTNKYSNNIGIDNCTISFGHDEYLYQVLKYNRTKIPEEGLNIIRYHSLYVWHTFGAYRELMCEKDYTTLKLVQMFNKFDLYTKENKQVDFDKEYYIKLIEKYIGLSKLTW